MLFYHADVFSFKCLSGNGLTIIFHNEELDSAYMQRIAQEFKQFETIFLKKTGENHYRARIFTVEEELDFAGHPILGATSTIHEHFYADARSKTVVFELNNKILQAESLRKEDYFEATMNQGRPEFKGTIEGEYKDSFLKALNLTERDLHPDYPMEVVSTGLPYLIVPLSSGLDKAKISVDNFEELLGQVQAKFVYVFDVNKMEGRSWDNMGTAEDVATGSAAGPAGAYLYKWNRYYASEDIIIHQGSFVGRPSKIKVFRNKQTDEIMVSGDVKIVAKGELLL